MNQKPNPKRLKSQDVHEDVFNVYPENTQKLKTQAPKLENKWSKSDKPSCLKLDYVKL